jgi:hypothetical protein
LKPDFVNYWNPQDDKIQLALQEAVRRLRAQGKPLVRQATDDKWFEPFRARPCPRRHF